VLVAYLAVAFALTHASSSASPTGPNIAPWVPHDSSFVRIPRKEGGFAVRFRPAVQLGSYGALVPTVTSNPRSGRRYIVGLWLKGSRPGRIGVTIDEFAPGTTSVYLVNTAVRAARRWRHFTFSARVKGTWLGLGMYVYRIDHRRRTWFAVRDLTVTYR
jgi:hypothetical protein